MAQKTKTTNRTARFMGNLELAAGKMTQVVDTAYLLSKLNHRLYRQGRVYTVKVDADPASFEDANQAIEVWALAPTWYLKSAWRMAKKAYDDAMADELAQLSPSNVARWRDFRIGAGINVWSLPQGDVDVLENGGAVPSNYSLGPIAIDNATTVDYAQGEYNLSYAHDLETGVNKIFHLGANSARKFGIFEEFQKSRNESASPETVITEMPYEALKAEGEDDDYVELQANGNEPPYNATAFGTQIWIRVGYLRLNSDLQRLSTGYFDAPLGMVATRAVGGGASLVQRDLTITVKEGEYHGVHSTPM